MTALAGSTDFRLRNLGCIGRKQQNAVAVKQQTCQQAVVSHRWLLGFLGPVDELKQAVPVVLIRFPGLGLADTHTRRHKKDCYKGKYFFIPTGS